jgi:hypothetical protein
MSMKALNKFLGRSTIDPAVLKAFEEGRIDEVMRAYDFSPEILHQMNQLEAVDFNQFAELAFQVVESFTEIDRQIQVPDPLEGLRPERGQTKEEQVA